MMNSSKSGSIMQSFDAHDEVFVVHLVKSDRRTMIGELLACGFVPRSKLVDVSEFESSLRACRDACRLLAYFSQVCA